MIKKIFLALALVFLSLGNVHAQDSAYSGPTADHIAGGLEKVVEKATLYTKFSKKAKAEYMEKLLAKRLGEIAYAVDNDQDKIETSASRYSTYIGSLTNYAVANGVSEEKDDLLNLYAKHGENLSQLRDTFEYDSGWWLAIQHGVNNTEWLSNDIQKL